MKLPLPASDSITLTYIIRGSNFGERYTILAVHIRFLFSPPLSSRLDKLCWNVYSHDFRSAKSSSKSLYPFACGSFAILSASSIAAIVFLSGSNMAFRKRLSDKCCRYIHAKISKSLSAFIFKSESIRMLMFVVEQSIILFSPLNMLMFHNLLLHE